MQQPNRTWDERAEKLKAISNNSNLPESTRIRANNLLFKLQMRDPNVKVWTKQEVEANRSAAYQYII